MHIGLVLSSTPAYSETFFNSKIKGLQQKGHTVTLYVQQKDLMFDLCPVVTSKKVYRWKFQQLISLFFTLVRLLPHYSKVRRFVRLENQLGISKGALLKKIYLNAHILSSHVDWLHFGFATQALSRENTALAIKAKMAVSFRGFDINVYPLKHPGCYGLLWERVDKVHSISNYLLDKAYEMGLSGSVPSAIITPAVAINALPQTLEPKLKEPLHLVTIARLHWIKGLDVALKAMALLKEKEVSFYYHILGGGDAKEKERYLYQAHQMGLKEQVVFHGKMNHQDTLKTLKDADLYLQPSLNEGFCNAVLEAQAMGRLCVVSNAGGLPENVLDNQTGWLFNKGSEKDLRDKILEVLQLSEETIKTISRQAKDRVATNFSIEKQQREFVTFYESLNKS